VFSKSRASVLQAQRTILKGVLTRLSGSTGFQLINVSNAPIVLKGRAWPNLLVNKVSGVHGGALFACTYLPAWASARVNLVAWHLLMHASMGCGPRRWAFSTFCGASTTGPPWQRPASCWGEQGPPLPLSPPPSCGLGSQLWSWAEMWPPTGWGHVQSFLAWASMGSRLQGR
jgi:hypothetical protein